MPFASQVASNTHAIVWPLEGEGRKHARPPRTLITQFAVRMAVKAFKFKFEFIIVHVSMKCARISFPICHLITYSETTRKMVHETNLKAPQ